MPCAYGMAGNLYHCLLHVLVVLLFLIEHCLNCHQGGFTIIRHNGIRNLTARLLGEVCHQFTIEPVLQLLSGESLCPSSAITTDNAGWTSG